MVMSSLVIKRYISASFFILTLWISLVTSSSVIIFRSSFFLVCCFIGSIRRSNVLVLHSVIIYVAMFSVPRAIAFVRFIILQVFLYSFTWTKNAGRSYYPGRWNWWRGGLYSGRVTYSFTCISFNKHRFTLPVTTISAFIQLASFFTSYDDICLMLTSGVFHVGMKEAIIWFKQT